MSLPHSGHQQASMSHAQSNNSVNIHPGHLRYLRSMSVLGTLLLLSEIWKQWLLTKIYGSYQVWYFPFQLCSLPLYLCPLMVVLPEKWQDRIRTFLMTFTLLGGAAAFLDTSGMQYPLSALTLHSYLWHIVLIIIGIWSGIDYCRSPYRNQRITCEKTVLLSESAISTKRATKVSPSPMHTSSYSPLCEFAGCLPIFGAAILIATILNVALWPYGEISMFYISPYEAGTQPIVPLVAAKIGIHTAHLLYLLAMAATAYLIHCMWRSLCRRQF